MFSAKIRVIVVCLSALALAGCSNLTWFQETQRVTGPEPLIEPESFEKIDLAYLLDPDNGGKVVDANKDKKLSEAEEFAEQRKDLERAFQIFYKPGNRILVRDRNRIQERIIAASNQRCGQYKNFIKQFDAAANLTLGGLTTVLAGAGAIFTNIDVVRALSGAASIFSGLRAEVNEAYFQNLTIQVITDGFESKRREIYEEIVKKRRASTTMVDYPVEKAIGDAILYHQHCSLIAGLEQAALSIQRAENPGITAINKTLRQLSATRVWMDAVTGEKTILDALAADEAITRAISGPRPLESFGKANVALGRLKTERALLAETRAVEEILTVNGVTYDDSTASPKRKNLQKALKDYGAKKKGNDLLTEINKLIADEKKDKLLEKREKEVGDWTLAVEKAGALTSKHRTEGTELAAYYRKWEEVWIEKTEAAQNFINKMKKFMSDAVKAKLDPRTDLKLTPLKPTPAPKAVAMDIDAIAAEMKKLPDFLYDGGKFTIIDAKADKANNRVSVTLRVDKKPMQKVSEKDLHSAIKNIPAVKGQTFAVEIANFDDIEGSLAGQDSAGAVFEAIADENDRIKVQKALCLRDANPIDGKKDTDGKWGPRTEHAVLIYQHLSNAEPTNGVLTQAQKDALMQAEDADADAICKKALAGLYSIFAPEIVNMKGDVEGFADTTFAVAEIAPDPAKEKIDLTVSVSKAVPADKESEVKAAIAKAILAKAKWDDYWIGEKHLVITLKPAN